MDNLFVKYVFKGKNPFASRHVKQTPHDSNIFWASNQYLIVFKVSPPPPGYMKVHYVCMCMTILATECL